MRKTAGVHFEVHKESAEDGKDYSLLTRHLPSASDAREAAAGARALLCGHGSLGGQLRRLARSP